MVKKYPLCLPREDEGINIQEKIYVISADLGQANDYTAISILEKVIDGKGVLGFRGQGMVSMNLRHIERPPRGTDYITVVDRLIELYRSEPLKGFRKAVVIDFTGLGRPVYDIMRKAGFRRSLNAISITGGNDDHYVNGHYNVPKRDLIVNLQIQLQNGTLKIAKGLKEANALIEELANFQTKISDSGRDTYNAREGLHDDIVLSVAMGAWLANERRFSAGTDDRM